MNEYRINYQESNSNFISFFSNGLVKNFMKTDSVYLCTGIGKMNFSVGNVNLKTATKRPLLFGTKIKKISGRIISCDCNFN